MPILLYRDPMYNRGLDLKKLVNKTSHFLFGPRATGKTSLIESSLGDVKRFDLLDPDVFHELLKRPKALSEKITQSDHLIVIDEIQKLPNLLDEVQRLMMKNKINFLLTGSSVRKLRTQTVNLLGGRAREAQLFPLTSNELGADFELMKYLNYGGLPIIYQSNEPLEDLKAYTRTYLSEEIKAEALVRNYESYVRFLEVMAISNAQEINYQSISSDSGVPVRTLQGYMEVLKDTLVGFELMPYQKTIKRKATTKSKFYFFDCGVSNFLSERYQLSENTTEIGNSFEQFIILEVRAYLSYSRSLKKMSYWRSKKLEVDLIVGDDLAIEIKFSKTVKDSHFENLRALKEEKKIKNFMLIARFDSSGVTDDQIQYMSYQEFLKKLWAHQLPI